jgi:hypothetical protein
VACHFIGSFTPPVVAAKIESNVLSDVRMPTTQCFTVYELH